MKKLANVLNNIAKLPRAVREKYRELKELTEQRARLYKHFTGEHAGTAGGEIGTYTGFVTAYIWYVNRLWEETKDLPVITVPVASTPMTGFVADESKIERLMACPSNHPIIVVKDLYSYRVIDGNHRLETARRNGSTLINAIVIEKDSAHEVIDLFGPNGKLLSDLA